jgi:hypothetical protein
MDTAPRRRLFREYVWFAVFLLAVLVTATIQESRKAAMRGHSAILTVASTPH